jgi:putative glycosyl hydrolase-like family 6 (GHL6) protein
MASGNLDRRSFIEILGGAAAATAAGRGPVEAARLAPQPAPSAAIAPRPPAPAWCDRPMRWAQLVLVENDPGQVDVAFWLDYFRRVHADGVCLSAGGIVAYYPTEVPLHHRSAWLGTSDPFGELVAGCRKMNMAVIARTDPHATRDDMARAHEDWIATDPDGRLRRHWANQELWITCALGPYNFEFMTAVHREIVTRYDVDGIFTNRWANQSDCHCEHCRRNFRAFSGLDLPRTPDEREPARPAYIRWRRARLTELWDVWDADIRRARPAACFIPNGPPDLRTAGVMQAPIQFADYQARRGLTPPWSNGRRAKEYHAVMDGRPVGGIFSVGVEEPHRWKDSVQSEAEIRLWVADGTANGMRPWFAKFAGVLRDRRWLPVVERIYDWHHRHERYLRNTTSLARVALLLSEQTATWYEPGRVRPLADHVAGMYHALVEARMPFDLVHEAFLTPERLDRYAAVVLANAAALSDAQCAALRAYAARGGGLVATFESSRYDEEGRKRPDFGLADLFGVRDTGGIEGPMKNSYLTLNTDSRTGRRHEILAGLDDAPRVINGVWRVRVTPAADGPAPLTLVPSYPDLPMEDVFPRQERTDTRELYLNEPGRGRVAYFPWDVDRTFWEVLSPDHGTLIGNAVRWASRGAAPATVTGPGLVEVTVWRQAASMTVHLVNLSNPMCMKGPLRELLPVGAQRVRVTLPDGARATNVTLLTLGASPQAVREGPSLTIDVPSVLDHEVVAIDLA